MSTGKYLEIYFEKWQGGVLDVKDNGEADVLCPFPHDKGYEKRPSAHINVNKGVFHCKTCFAEGRFKDNAGGLSEVNFVAHINNVPYEEAIKMLSMYDNIKQHDFKEDLTQAITNLLTTESYMEFLRGRGIFESEVKQYQLYYTGDGIVYPVFMNGVIVDRRTYFMNREEGQPKIKSQRKATPMLFPYDHWMDSLRQGETTLLTAGENDTILARKNGFNAVTSTMGEGSFPKMLLGHFKGQTVYICYDCDEAGKKGALKVAFMLREAGATVYIMDLGLTGTKDDKDVTDFIIKNGRSAADLSALMDTAILFDGELYAEVKNENYPLVDLWEVTDGKYSGRRLSSRVIMMGKFSTAMETPSAIQYECGNFNPENDVCAVCPLQRQNRLEGWWTLDEHNLDDVLELVEVNKVQQNKKVNQMIGIPAKCPQQPRKWIRAVKHVTKVILSADVDTEDELNGWQQADQYAYVIGMNLEDGQRYRAFFRRYAHPLDDQRIVLVVDRVEDSDNTINTFKVTPEIILELTQFQGDPKQVMEKRYQNAKQIIGNFAQRNVVAAVDIAYHSVLDFRYAKDVIKGHPEGLIIGASRTGKSDTALKLQQFYGLGNFTECKTATTAGLLGGADKLPSGEHRIKWGKIPRNHKGLLVLDELSGMPMGVMSSLTGLRSQRNAIIEKIVSGKAPAKTRMIWISNPRVQSDGKSLNIADYPNGVKIVLDLIGSDEDIARFDFVYILPNIEAYISPFTKEELEKVDNQAYRHLIQWIWSRTSDQVKFDKGVEEYVWQMAQQLNEKYDTDVKFFGAEAHKKLARISVSIAGMCFSHVDNGSSILVTKDHVDWAVDFMVGCYDNDIFRLVEYAQQAKLTTTTNEEINASVAGLIHSNPLIMKTLANNTECTLRELEAVSGLDRKIFQDVFARLIREGLISTAKEKVMATRRFRLAVKAYRETHEVQRLRPLTEKGMPI
jgi:predicted transcriptional regulator